MRMRLRMGYRGAAWLLVAATWGCGSGQSRSSSPGGVAGAGGTGTGTGTGTGSGGADADAGAVTEVDVDGLRFSIFSYEASLAGAKAVSKKDVAPAVSVDYAGAKAACTASGYRL